MEAFAACMQICNTVCWVFRFGCALPGTPAQHGLEAGREIRQVVIAVAPARVDDLRKVFCEASQDGLLANQGTLSESIFLGRAIDWPKFHAIPLRRRAAAQADVGRHAAIYRATTDRERRDSDPTGASAQSCAGSRPHDPHRPRRIGLRSGDPRHGRQRGSTRGQVQKLSATPA
jgi:hypothetical protein